MFDDLYNGEYYDTFELYCDTSYVLGICRWMIKYHEHDAPVAFKSNSAANTCSTEHTLR